MKTKMLIMLIACLGFGPLLNAAGVNEKNANLASVIKLMKVSNKNININCWTNEEFATRIGTTESELNDYIRDLFQSALEDTKKSVQEDNSMYFLHLNQYDLSAAGYPYNNFQHTIEYVIYDENMNEVYTGNHRFATFSNVSKDELTKQFKKLSKKILSVINKK
ncbi:hypothetical protein [Bacteroides sp.]|uniref:hypothetical protein n=1 Tax=Bacteroides sp. TaxID=29523 RepID=UPI003AB2DD01